MLEHIQDRPKCGKKIKTLYAGHGAKATFEATGHYCKHCDILCDQELEKSAGASNMLEIDTAQTVIGIEQDRVRFQEEPLTVRKVQQLAPANFVRENQWMGPDSNQRPPACKAGILTRLDNPST